MMFWIDKEHKEDYKSGFQDPVNKVTIGSQALYKRCTAICTICIIHAFNLCAICVQYVQNMCAICVLYVYNMCHVFV